MIKTQLYDEHVRLGGKMVDFGGFLLPVQYSGIVEEHHAVRRSAGLFDVSHMGEFIVKGSDALNFLQFTMTNDMSKLVPGRAMYAVLCNEEGGCIDDVLTYMLNANKYMIVPNAANIAKDFAWFEEQRVRFSDVSIEDVSDTMGLFALQGPMAEAFLMLLCPEFDLKTIRFYRFQDKVDVAGIECLLSRTGYTGEDGFELYHHKSDSERLWKSLMELSIDGLSIRAAGLGARDSLRLEAGLPLYGHELTEDVTPIEAGLDRFVKLDKAAFIGQDALRAIADKPEKKRLIGLETIGRGIPRATYAVLLADREIGMITSGGMAPTLDKQIAMALIDDDTVEEGQILGVRIRNRVIEHKVVPLPFYKRTKT